MALGAFSLCVFSSAAPAAYSYPASTCALLAVSTTVPNAGASITVAGTSFEPGEHLTIMIHSTPVALGTVTTSAAGTFSKVVRIPASFSGHHDIYTVGGTDSCPADPVVVQVAGHGVAGESTGPASPGQSTGGAGAQGGGLPFTGFDAFLFLMIALAAVAAGLLFARAGRQNRRRRSRRYYLGGNALQ
ncbi:MAG: hypothetical protein ABI232_00385 [Jatrophihabitantaceae bacterium]